MILVIDNYDSFTYNLVQYVGQCQADAVVVRNDQIDLAGIEAMEPSGILLSPGPCTPNESGICLDVLGAALRNEKSFFASIPIFGVCLGCQAMGLAGGGVVARAGRVMHGKASPIRHDGQGMFAGLPNPVRMIRYHSLAVRPDAVPEGFLVTATAEDDGEIMGLRHERLPIEGVQFHPESVLSESGLEMIRNFVRSTRAPLGAV